MDQGGKPNPCDGTTDSQEDACGEETERNRTLSAVKFTNYYPLNTDLILEASLASGNSAECG